MHTKTVSKIVAVIAVAALAGTMTLKADQEISFGYNMPLKVTLNVNESACYNSPGPFITLEGVIELGGLEAQLIFQNNVKGTHQNIQTISTSVVLLPAGQSITIPKQPVLGGVGGNPWIYIQFFNAQGDLSPEILLGRCVQGLTVSEMVLDQALVSTLVTATDCSNNPGPWITLEGDITLSGLKVRIIFKNNVKGTHTNVQTAEVELMPPGLEVVIPKQPSRGGVGGNPWIWLQFLSEGAPIGDPYFLGRCSDL